jgi:carbamoyltransferase
LLREQRFPHSLGLLYSAFTYFTGFRVNSGEYKVMGLAPYGEPRYVPLIKEHLVDIRDDGSLWMNMEYFTYPHGLTMTGAALQELLGGPPRQPESPLTQREMDLARSIQEITEEVMLKMTAFAHRETGMRDLCLAGGVALNCVGNGRIQRESPFERVWIQPAAGDAGGSIGVALALWHRYLNKPRVSPEWAGTWERSTPPGAAVPKYADGMSGSYLGPQSSEPDIAEFVAVNGYRARRLEPSQVAECVAELLAEEKVIGLVLGRMEFGPRALGARSIIGDARSPKMQSVMNLKIKFRESFRPFAPSVLEESAADYFDMSVPDPSPYMLLVAPVQKSRRLDGGSQSGMQGLDKLKVQRSQIPAVTHVDYSARVQTVDAERHPLFHALISRFRDKTGCPLLINTSFNVRGEPIVASPADAYRCFMATDVDVLVIESFILLKSDQPPLPRSAATSYVESFELD